MERSHCDCCEKPIEGDSYPSKDHEATVCARCCVSLLGGQVEHLDRQLEGAVGTLESIAKVLDRGTADDRKLATISRLVNEALASPVAWGAVSVSENERCERLLVGQGGDSWDPLCWRPKGHPGICEAVETIGARVEAEHAGAVHSDRVAPDQELRPQPDQSVVTPTPKVLLCLGPCHGEFYLPLDWNDVPVCPNDRTHDVAVYGDLIVRRYCDRCGAEKGLHEAGSDLCNVCRTA